MGRSLCKHGAKVALCQWPVKGEVLKGKKWHRSFTSYGDPTAVANPLRGFQLGITVASPSHGTGVPALLPT